VKGQGGKRVPRPHAGLYTTEIRSSRELKPASNLPIGGMYMVSEKQASSSLRISQRLRSYDVDDDGECVKPTPASQMYSQLSIVDMSSGLSWQKHALVANSQYVDQNSQSVNQKSINQSINQLISQWTEGLIYQLIHQFINPSINPSGLIHQSIHRLTYRSLDCLTDSLIDWLINWFTDWQSGWLIVRWTDWLVDRLIDQSINTRVANQSINWYKFRSHWQKCFNFRHHQSTNRSINTSLITITQSSK